LDSVVENYKTQSSAKSTAFVLIGNKIDLSRSIHAQIIKNIIVTY